VSGHLGPVVLQGGTVLDETGSRRADVVVSGGVVSEVGMAVEVPAGAQVLDALGCLVVPGLVDLHAHLREPGGEWAETIESGANAAAAGGFSAVVAMPNTTPPVDSPAMVQEIRRRAEGAAVEVVPAATLSVGRAGEKLAPFAELFAAGVRIFTDDGAALADAWLARQAMSELASLGACYAEHCEDPSLAAGTVMHEGAWSSRLGLAGSPSDAEVVVVARDLELARSTGVRLHLLHCSTARAVELAVAARRQGVAVTVEVTPHHLTLSDDRFCRLDPSLVVRPPLRTQDDVDRLVRACVAGEVDAVATDHAPHPPEAKEVPLDEAAPGMVGLETAFPLTLAALLSAGGSVEQVVALLSWQPARIAGLWPRHGGPIRPGSSANLAVLDPSRRWVVEAERLASASANTPWLGATMTGRARHLLVEGRVVLADEVLEA
jgi:dihydroorotase